MNSLGSGPPSQWACRTQRLTSRVSLRCLHRRSWWRGRCHSVTAVTRSLKPFVPEDSDSQYHKMVERAQEEQALLMKNRRQNHSYYNEGYVLPVDPVGGYNLDNSSSKSSPGKAGPRVCRGVALQAQTARFGLKAVISQSPSGVGAGHRGGYTLRHPNVVHRCASPGCIRPTVASGGGCLDGTPFTSWSM